MALESGRSLGRRRPKPKTSLKALAGVASVAAGVQFGWALQLSLLTPYVQELGIPHQFASLIWLCGPISGMFVQPIIGHYSDQCTSRYGRRRPFIVIGALLVVVSVLVIGFSADIGSLLGDTSGSKPRAIVVFVAGFWLLDLANNTLQGPCRALLADLAGKDQTRTRRANAFFSLFMAVGNILGFATGAYDKWAVLFGFTQTEACDAPCANLKSAFLLGTIILGLTTVLSVTSATEIPWTPEKSHPHAHNSPSAPLLPEKPLDGQSAHEISNTKGAEDDEEDDDEEEPSEALFWELMVALRDLPKTMWYILLVTALTWIAWFPFLLFDTDWMGREVYFGEPNTSSEIYYGGVHMGSLGLMLNSVVLGITSLLIDFMCRKLGPSRLWGLSNALMAVCFASTAIITTFARRESLSEGYTGPSDAVIASALTLFAVLGAPLAVTYSVPYALTATYAEKSGGGQGLSMGVLNLAVVTPQVIISVGSGPFDSLFGGGNLPSFLLASASALVGGIAAVLLLPRPPPSFRYGSLKRTRSSPIP